MNVGELLDVVTNIHRARGPDALVLIEDPDDEYWTVGRIYEDHDDTANEDLVIIKVGEVDS